MNEKLKGLFINCPIAQDSIFESGKMAYDCLAGSTLFSLDYVEISRENRAVSSGYDFYLFNYHFATMDWLDVKSVKELLPGLRMTIVLEISPNDPFVHCPSDAFDAYVVLDPTLKGDERKTFAFPRPLEVFGGDEIYQPEETPVIGSFGLATPGKGFETIIEAVNREFDRAIVKMNLPYATYVAESAEFAQKLTANCRRKAKRGIEVVITHDFMTKPELIKWCAANTINCFFYDRNLPGLAAATDQAISSGRPLLITKNNTFRHIQSYIKPFPYQTIRQAMLTTPNQVRQIQHDWSPVQFRRRFETVLGKFEFAERTAADQTFELKILPAKKDGSLQKVKDAMGLRTRIWNWRNGYGFSRSINKGETIETPIEFHSRSQFGEDRIVYELLTEQLNIQNIRYLDVGANEPEIFNNTYSFYEQNARGVLVEPNADLCEKLRAARPSDTILNAGIGVGDAATEARFYQFDNANNGLSTFSSDDANRWETIGMDGVKRPVEQVLTVKLLNINAVIADYFTECPDFISLDVEGWDLRVLQTFDFAKHNPAVFCVETLCYNRDGSTYRNAEIVNLLEANNYLVYRETTANTIFVNRNLYDFHLYQQQQSEKSN